MILNILAVAFGGAKIFHKNNSADDSFSKNRNLRRIHNIFNIRTRKRKLHHKQKSAIFRALRGRKHILRNSMRFRRTELHKIKKMDSTMWNPPITFTLGHLRLELRTKGL